MSTMLEKIGWYVNRTIDSVLQSFFDSCKLFEKTLVMERQKRIQNLIKDLRWSILYKNGWVSDVNFFRK